MNFNNFASFIIENDILNKIITFLKSTFGIFIIVFVIYIIVLWIVYKIIIKKYYDNILNKLSKLKINKTTIDTFFKKSKILLQIFIFLGGINIAYHASGFDFGNFKMFLKIVYVIEVALAILIIDKAIKLLKTNIIKKFKKE